MSTTSDKQIKKTQDYWRDRIAAENALKQASDRSLAREMEELYAYHFKAIETEIEAFINRYADKNAITKQEVLKRVDDFDVQAFATKAKKYVEEKDFSDRANKELALYNLKMKVNRLELLEYQLDLELVALSEGEHKLTDRFLRDGFESEARLQAGLLGQSVGASLASQREAILNTPFHGATWSDSIWKRQKALRTIVARGVETAILRGRNALDLVPQIRREFEVGAFEARRLAITEVARVQIGVQKTAMETAGFDQFEVMPEDRACVICKSKAAKPKPVADLVAGVTAPPFHPFCRCAVVPVVVEWQGSMVANTEVTNDSGHHFKNHKEAERYAVSKGVQYSDFSKMKPEWYNAILNQLDKLPEDAMPVVLTDTKTLQQLLERKIGRSAKSYYGVSLYTPGDLKRINGELVQFRDGTWVGFNTVSYKTLKSVEEAKEKVAQLYFEKTGKKWSFLKTADETIAHEFGHVLDNYKSASDNWEWKSIAKKWYEESGYDHLKSPSEAWADAIGLVWNGKKAPDEVYDYIKKYSHQAFGNPEILSGSSNVVLTRLDRNKDSNKRRAINIVRQNKLTKSFRERGGIVHQSSEADEYLRQIGAAATNYNAETIILQTKPTISEVLEELYHAEQWRDGRIIDGDELSKIKAEIEAQHYLLSVEKRYNIPKIETEQTKRNLQFWEEALRNYEN